MNRRKSGPEPRRCFHCGKTGHIRRQCWQRFQPPGRDRFRQSSNDLTSTGSDGNRRTQQAGNQTGNGPDANLQEQKGTPTGNKGDDVGHQTERRPNFGA